MARDGEVKVSLTSRADVKGIKQTEQELNRLEKTNKKVSASNDQVAKSGKNTSLAFLEVSRAVEDAQYGFRGVINNIPQIITLFGGGAGLAAVVSLAAVAFATMGKDSQEASKNIDKSFNAVDLSIKRSKSSIESAKDAIAEYDDSISKANNRLEEQGRILEANLTKNLELAKIEAQIADDRRKLEKLQILSDTSLSDSQKAQRIEELNKQALSEQRALATQESEAKIERLTQQLESLQKAFEDARKREIAATPGFTGDILSEDIKFFTEQAKDDINKFNLELEKFQGSLKEGIGFFGALSADEIEDPLNELLAELAQARQTGSIEQQAEAIKRIFDIVKDVDAIGQSDDRVKASAEMLLVLSRSIQDYTKEADELRAEQEILNAKYTAAKSDFEAAKKALDSQDELLTAQIEIAKKQREAVDAQFDFREQILFREGGNRVFDAQNKENQERARRRLEEERRRLQQSGGLSSEFATAASDPNLRGSAAQKAFDAASKALADGTNFSELSKILVDLEKVNRETNLSVISSLKSQVSEKKAQLKKIQDLEYQLKNSNK